MCRSRQICCLQHYQNSMYMYQVSVANTVWTLPPNFKKPLTIENLLMLSPRWPNRKDERHRGGGGGGGVTCHDFGYGRAAGAPEPHPIHIHVLGQVKKHDPFIYFPYRKLTPFIHVYFFFKFYPFIYFLGENDTPLIYFWCENDTHSYTWRSEKYTPSSRTFVYTFIMEVNTPPPHRDEHIGRSLVQWYLLAKPCTDNFQNITYIFMHILLWMNVMLDYICMGFTELCGTGKKRKT